ncbi:hypothetical protein JCM19237_1120 [Photobacterium aphoticum]|uniref:Uncharacterized protein n=1 Tax=Photobacterium aphoticum TaxID=754436 RepID=A0A090QQC4_9GAMM|nr:hypothetical protein JCM19237_1120 [Photobacterium aphoticum]
MGIFELIVATGLVLWVGWNYIGMYWPSAGPDRVLEPRKQPEQYKRVIHPRFS